MKCVRKSKMVEAVQFNGSSSHKAQILKWINGGSCPEGEGIHTRDVSDLTVNTLTQYFVAQPGNFIIKGDDGKFFPVTAATFNDNYEKIGNQFYMNYEEEHF